MSSHSLCLGFDYALGSHYIEFIALLEYFLSLHPPLPPLPSPLLSFPLSLPEGVSLLLRHMFEQHQASNPVEEMVKGASNGDMVRVEQLLDAEACGVDDQFNGKTALHAAAQNGHVDVVRTLIHHHANLEEEVNRVGN